MGACFSLWGYAEQPEERGCDCHEWGCRHKKGSGAGSAASPTPRVAFAGRVGSGRKGSKWGPYDKIFKVALALLIGLDVDQMHIAVPCHGSSFAWACKSYWLLPPPPPFTVETGGGKKDHSGGHCEYTSAFATTATKETGAFLNETRIEERKKIPFLFFFFFPFPSPSFVLLLNQTDVVINLHSAAQLMWQSTKLIPLCKIQFTSGFSFFFFFLQNYVNFPINWRDHVSFLYCT